MTSILFLEDDKMLTKLYTKKLDAAGFQVFHAENCREALSLSQKHSIDIMLIDHGIKGDTQTGIDIVPELRKNCQNAKIFILSNYNQQELEKTAKNNGADDFFIKIDTPPKKLIEIIQQNITEEA
ncbi:hypothetical protein COB57_02165 [Candidatus Peregrinibacteria bacterium]|nr:MAG: hypothetical protein COB57_02165 [Candidatus Peregrinibacteria bacterium]